jgi:crotonobetainyl-CoA:carnitine CoA-transferase CaiB-like acyl-CoA transferase
LLRALGRPEFLDLAKGEPGRSQGPLIDYFAATFKTKTRAEWETFLEPLDLCWAPVRSLKDGFGDANAVARAILLRDADGNPHIGPAIKFRNQPAEPKFELPPYDPKSRPTWR